MRNWNKLLALVLAMVMVFGLTATSFATEADGDKKEDTTDTTDTTATDEDKTDDTAPAEDADKTDDAGDKTDAEDAEKTEDTAPADDAEKTGDAAEPETTEPAVEIDYTGVAEWAKEHVAFVVGEKKYVALRETGLEPTATMTRAEMVAALYNLAGAPAVEGKNEFTDVADTASYKNAVVWAVANGITDGLGDGTFNPNGELTRQHIAVFLYRYVKNVAKGDVTVESDNLAVFPDADTAASWGRNEMNWAVANKVINGNGNLLDPNGSAQRQMAITILSRYIKDVLPAAEAAAPTDDAADADAAADAAADADKADDAAADADKADDAAADADKAADATDTEKAADADKAAE